MKRRNIKIDGKILDKISSSEVMTDSEKMSFMKFVGYMTTSEQKELVEII
ncbi:MAG: hypothetical protein PHV23_00725 [Candidatus Gracilibacteria bacterium]|nr:hypothetical protein [Candidatus Gracilibacteria bacterium]